MMHCDALIKLANDEKLWVESSAWALKKNEMDWLFSVSLLGHKVTAQLRFSPESGKLRYPLVI